MTPYRLTSRLLCMAVHYLAPSSRALVPSFNKSVTSIGRCIQPRLILDFNTESGRAAVQAWYKRQGSHTRFTLLEYRKDKRGPFKHEFVIVRLDQTTLCRVDRRPRENLRGHALKEEGTASEDSIHILSSHEAEYEDVFRHSEMLLSINFPDGEDLKFILAVCFGIQTHPFARSYSFLQYNCYFFTWTIVTTVARRALRWEDTVTSQEVWREVVRAVDARICNPIPRKASIRTRVKAWLTGSPPIQNQLGDSDTEDFWLNFKARLHSHPAPNFSGHLQNLLLRSQLSSAVTDRIMDVVKAVCFSEIIPLVEIQVADAIFGYLTPIRLMPSARTNPDYVVSPQGGQYPDYRERALIQYACFQAASLMIRQRRETKYTRDSKANGFSLLLDAAWDDACARIGQSNTAIELKGRLIWQGTAEKYLKEAHRQCGAIGKDAAGALLKRLTDVDSERIVFGQSIRSIDPLYKNQGLSDTIGIPESSNVSLQGYIRHRMLSHFKNVDKYGFGTFDDLLVSTEQDMCQIWVTAIHTVNNNIENWGEITPKAPAPGSSENLQAIKLNKDLIHFRPLEYDPEALIDLRPIRPTRSQLFITRVTLNTRIFTYACDVDTSDSDS